MLKLDFNKLELYLGIIIVVVFAIVGLSANFLMTYEPDAISLLERLKPMSKLHLLGTDEMGRDVFARIVYGIRYSFIVVLLVAAISAPIGFIIGLYAGFYQGLLGSLLMRFTDLILAFPRLILALTLVAILGPGLSNAIMALGLTVWASYARFTRSYVLSIKQKEFITALKLQGASDLRIMFKHIAPLCIEPLFVQISLDMSGFMLAVAGLGFLGLGAQPPTPEWGAMISLARDYGFEHWWVFTFPGVAIVLLSLGFNLIGEGLKQQLDPRL
jgi:peptide/nickel transport system permease protein